MTEPAPAPSTTEHRRRPRPAAATLAAALIIAAGLGAAGFVAGRASAGGQDRGTAGARLSATEPDAGFVIDMLDHHEQAVELAAFVQTQTGNDVVRALAQAVISDQRWEIGWMEAWLADRGIDRPVGDRTTMAWMGMPVPRDQMPGLASPAEVVALYNRSGADLDRAFLELMLRHHEGGVHMAEYAAAHAADPMVRDLASRIVVKQRNEINDLHQLLG